MKAEKILLLGVDGLDPRLTRKYVDMGIMPNTRKLIERGACHEDLVLLGGHPTVTPSMWTTLATGAYANTHGITAFFRQDPEDLDAMGYNLDSRLCEAEQLWNSFAEAGKKTLVWHWPGSSWPPTSDSPNLMVVDGTSPGGVGMGYCQRENEYILVARETIKELTLLPKAASSGLAPCVIEDLEMEKPQDDKVNDSNAVFNTKKMQGFSLDPIEAQANYSGTTLDVVRSPIKAASGWAAAPADAKEFTLLMSSGLLRRPCLILKNEQGIYDRIAIYKSKKETEPLRVLKVMQMEREIVDECIKADKHYTVARDMELLELTENGDSLKLYISPAMDTEDDSVWHPKSMFKKIMENVGFIPPSSQLGGQDPVLINECMLKCWDHVSDWQSDALHYMIEHEGVEVIFSHFHSVDLEVHTFMRYLTDKGEPNFISTLPPEMYQKFLQDIYKQTDTYLGKFMHLLDEGWVISLFSDHGQVCPTYVPPLLGNMGFNLNLMEDLGYTVVKRDENGNRIAEVDWSKTRAVANRELNIYINLKGRDKNGIVDPKDKYELEEQIITDLYSYKHPKSGKRVVALALHNKDAVLLGYGGPNCGDICYWIAEGYNYDHSDSLSTTWGECDTSVSPTFIIAGTGIKQGYTKRIIRQVDFAPTIAALGGVRIPAQCEGAPVYQILEGGTYII